MSKMRSSKVVERPAYNTNLASRVIERRVLRLSREDQTAEEDLRGLPGISGAELAVFRKARGDFVHSYSAWIAVVIHGTPVDADLAILTRTLPDFQTGEGYVLLSRMSALQQALFDHIDSLESSIARRVSLQWLSESRN
jgi:hypothetical protein